jgi:haloalkane dehalogenase
MSATAITTPEIIEAHRKSGRFVKVDGIRTFIREQGNGHPVVCSHGMWGSSYLYRKVLHELASRALRGICWDLPGFGLTDRPADFDYSWSGLGRFAISAVDVLRLERFHLVVHDVGGPIGFELAAARPDRIASLTILNTMIDVTEFRPPWPMAPFRHRGVGELWLAGLNKPLFRQLMKMQGIGNPDSVSKAELGAYLDLMRGEDAGRSFLKIMRSNERTQEKQALYRSVVRDVPYPVQVVWAADDPALKLSRYGEQARAAAALKTIHTIPGRHFPQEDQAPAIAEHIATIAGRAERTARPDLR